MPLLRYFGWVGSFLLAGLFAANWFMAAPVGCPDVPIDHKFNIRIHTDQKWPERVVFDTAHPMLAPEASVDSGKAIAENEPGPFDAFAEMAAIPARPCFRPPCSASQDAEREGGSIDDKSRQFKSRSRIAERKGLTFPNRSHTPPGRS